MSIEQAIILAGGQATRMRPYTDDAPKAMVPVAGSPILGYQLLWLAEHGVKQVVLSVGYRADLIRAYVGDGSRFGLSAAYAVEDEPLGRGGGMKLATRQLADPAGDFLALNGDVITHFDLGDLIEGHARSGAAVTIALSPYRSNWGVVDIDEADRVRGFVQSPVLPYWINSGVYAMASQVSGLLPDKGDHEDTTFPALAEQDRMRAFRIDGYWRGIDTVKDVKEATGELLGQGRELPVRFRLTGA
ncbi:nucleotidyltransferase family protein [Streptomyces sp. SID3343]|uniref:nucleotidyltransferase family protein n=1 Tax=Streptomyces sp. SID3343 TaxID=2690260 RepID=UPI00192610C3|nr:nucleotidyltransferase family protein [Streptomyces sp. SID3343]